MKWFLQFLVIFCLLLTGAYGNTYAYGQHTCINHYRAQWAYTQAIIKPAPSGPQKRNDKVIVSDNEEEEKEEDDERNTVRTCQSIGNYLTTFFYMLTSEGSGNKVGNRLPFCEHFSYASSHRYIVLRVIRV